MATGLLSTQDLQTDTITDGAGTGAPLATYGINGSLTGAASVPALPLTLVSTDATTQVLNPAAAGDVNLPTTGVVAGETRIIVNRSKANALTIKASGGTTVGTVIGGFIKAVALQDAPTTNAHWYVPELQCETDSVSPAGVSYVFTGGGGASGPTHTMRWVQKDGWNTVTEHINWSGAGTAVTQVRFDIPVELPVPATGGTPAYSAGAAIEFPGNSACGVYLDQSGAASQVHYLMPASNITDIVGTYTYRV